MCVFGPVCYISHTGFVNARLPRSSQLLCDIGIEGQEEKARESKTYLRNKCLVVFVAYRKRGWYTLSYPARQMDVCFACFLHG
jgi:hypothetical protein